MLTIRREQMRQLQERLDERYCLELRDYFRELFPQQTAGQDDETLLKTITASIERARALDIRHSNALLRFAGIAVLVNPRFYDDQRVEEMFALEGIEPDYKVYVLSDQLIDAFQDMFEEA